MRSAASIRNQIFPVWATPGDTATIGNSDLNPGDISSFNPQPDIPGIGNPGDNSSFTPPSGGDPSAIGTTNLNPGGNSSFTPPTGGDPAAGGAGLPLAPGTDVEGAQPHMDTTGWMKHDGAPTDGFVGNPDLPTGAGNPDLLGGTPSWSAPGNPDHSTGSVAPGPPDRSFGGVVVVGIILLLLLVGAGGGFIALKQGVFGCQGSYYHGHSVTATLLTSCDAGKTSGGQTGVGANPTVAVAPTIPAAAPTATPAPQPSPTATATPKPRPPTPTVKITSPANNYIATNTDGTSPTSASITFRASASAGSGASSVTVTWVDSIDGTLGTGTTLSHTLSSKHNTSCGAATTHVVTAKAKNNLGGTASVSITVHVQPFCHS